MRNPDTSLVLTCSHSIMLDDFDWTDNLWTHELGDISYIRGLLITLGLLKNRPCYPNSGVRSGVCRVITVFDGADELADFCRIQVLLLVQLNIEVAVFKEIGEVVSPAGSMCRESLSGVTGSSLMGTEILCDGVGIQSMLNSRFSESSLRGRPPSVTGTGFRAR
jgi:hypothetical protein